MESSSSQNVKPSSVDSYITQEIRCPVCEYCLRGLPFTGRCPECGLRYIAENLREGMEAQQFESHIPALMRCGISPHFAVRRPFLMFIVWLLIAGVSSATFVGSYCLATKIGFTLCTPDFPPRYNSVAKFGIYGAKGGMLRWNLFSVYYLSIIFYCLHLIISLGLCLVYTVRTRLSRRHRRTVRRLGLLAACSSAPLILLPSLTMAGWQIVSMIAPLSRCGAIIGFPFYSRHAFCPFRDPIQIIGEILLVVTTIWVTTWIMKRHNAYVKSIQNILLEVRAIDCVELAED